MCAIMLAREVIATLSDGEMPMAVVDLLPSRYYVFAGAIAVTVRSPKPAAFRSEKIACRRRSIPLLQRRWN